VQKFDSEGNYLSGFGQFGWEEGEFSNPSDIAIDSEGNLLLKLGKLGKDKGKLKEPKGLALDNKRNIYVVDTGNNRIQKFSPDGGFIAQFGKSSLENIQFNSPSDLAIDPLEYIYIIDTGNNRIVKIAEAIKEGILIRGEKTFDLSYANISRGSKSQFFTDYPGIYPGINLEETLRVDVRSEPFKDIEVSGHFDDTGSILERQNIWLKIEGRNFGARLGNYRASFDDTEFGLYNKTLTGIKLYGEIGRLKLEAIGAKIEGISCRDEFEAEEMKLTYYLSRHPVVEGSEKGKSK